MSTLNKLRLTNNNMAESYIDTTWTYAELVALLSFGMIIARYIQIRTSLSAAELIENIPGVGTKIANRIESKFSPPETNFTKPLLGFWMVCSLVILFIDLPSDRETIMANALIGAMAVSIINLVWNIGLWGWVFLQTILPGSA